MNLILSRRFYVSKIPSILLGIFAFGLLVFTQSIRLSGPIFEKNLIAPPPMLERFSFGYQESLADALWIRALQDFDYCEERISKNVCKNNSWLGQMLDTATDLAPKFRIVYAAGGLALTVLISDVDGASKLFDKGAKEFPQDWPILYRAAYHFLYEVGDKKRAAELLIQAGKNGAPSWVFTLAGRLYSDNGDLELAERLLSSMEAENQDPHLIDRLKKKIERIKAGIHDH